MPLDEMFVAGWKRHSSERDLRHWRHSSSPWWSADRVEILRWVESLGSPLGGWTVSADLTFGSGTWCGKRRGKKRDRHEDLLTSGRKRGFDADDALLWASRFMDRVCPGVSWIAGVERNPDYSRLNPGWHVHMMWAGCDEIYRKLVAERWLEENGICKIAPIRSTVARGDYCTKHLLNRGSLLGWRINNSDAWRRLVRPEEVIL